MTGFEGLKKRSDTIPPEFRRLRLEAAAGQLIRLAETTGNPDGATLWTVEKAALFPVPAPPPRPAKDAACD